MCWEMFSLYYLWQESFSISKETEEDDTQTEPLEFAAVAHRVVSEGVILAEGHSITEPWETSFH